MIKAIFIDWGHVFAESFKNKERKKDAILKHFGFNWRTFLPYWRMFYILRSSGKIKNDNDLEKIIREVVKKDIPVKKLIKIDIENCLIPVEHIEVVKKLKKKYKVAILSNNVQEWVEQDIKNYKIGNLFNAIIISSEVGERKPNAKIYYEALRRLSVKPEESVFIADEVAEDLVAASGLGIKTIWFNTKSKGWWGKDDKNVLKIYKPNATIKKLSEVINVIEKL